MSEIMRSNMNNGYYPSQTDTGGKGLCKEVISKAAALLNYLIRCHNKVLVAAMTLRYPAGSDVLFPLDNSHICGLVQALTRFYTGKGCENKYIWVRESSPAGESHYHLLWLINGNQISNSCFMFREVCQRWSWFLGVENTDGLVYLVRSRGVQLGEAGEVVDPHGGIMVELNCPEFRDNYEEYISWASYLAECCDKGCKPSFVRAFGSSELPPTSV